MDLSARLISCVPGKGEEKRWLSHPFYFLLQTVQNIINLNYAKLLLKPVGPSSQLHDGVHLKILPTFLKVFTKNHFSVTSL